MLQAGNLDLGLTLVASLSNAFPFLAMGFLARASKFLAEGTVPRTFGARVAFERFVGKSAKLCFFRTHLA